MRRTTSIDTQYPEPGATKVAITVRGRDLHTPADANARVVDSLDFDLDADLALGAVSGFALSGPAAALNGAALRAGFRRDLGERLADAARARTLLYSVLEDLPGAFLVSGYALVREKFWPEDPADGPARALRQVNVCAGWEAERTPHLTLVANGVTPLPYGPVAPVLEADDPIGWHALAALSFGTVRRRRVMDVWRDGSTVIARAHFRDSFTSHDQETVMHEYATDVVVDGGGVVGSLVVTPRVLPWAECPNAIASAQEVVGLHTDEIGERVRRDFHGTRTCTHLNSTLKTLADIAALSRTLN